MMTGRVSALHILVSVPFRRIGEPNIAIEFVVDTGFTGELCLPPEAVVVLGLPFRYDLRAHLADDSSVMLPVHDATILWHDVEFEVSSMNKPEIDLEDDDVRPEYGPEVFARGVRGKHFASYQAGTNLALLAPDVRSAFPTDEPVAVNEALRCLCPLP
jgi:clan AA aspartic protease